MTKDSVAKERDIMRCDRCGTINDDESRFCVGCGTPLGASGRTPRRAGSTPTSTWTTRVLTVMASVLLVLVIALGATYLLTSRGRSGAEGAAGAGDTTATSEQVHTTDDVAGKPQADSQGERSSSEGASNTHSVKDVLHELSLDDARVILLQNFISTMYTGGVEGVSSEDLAQFAPLVEEARRLFGESLDELGLEDVSLDGITFDLLEDPQVTRLGNNGVQIVVRCVPRVDGAGDKTLEDLWNIVFATSGGIEDATVVRS